MSTATIAPPGGTTALLAQPLVTVRGTALTWREWLAALEFLGQLQPLVEDLRQAAALVRAADGQALPLPAEQLQAMADQVRYHFNLITGEETAAWLAQRGLELADLHGFVQRRYLLAHPEHLPGPPPEPLPLTGAELAPLLWAELLLADLTDELARPVLRRYLVEWLRLHEETFEPRYLEEARRTACHRWRLAAADSAPATTLFLGDAWDEHLRREAVYQQYCDRVAAPANCRKSLAARRPQLYRVEYEIATLARLEEAREAYLCVTIDGEPLATLAERIGVPYERAGNYVEDLPEELATHLVSGASGELLEPLTLNAGGYAVVWLHEKQEPTLDDAEVAQRVRRYLIEEHFQPYLEQEVQWPPWHPAHRP
jgi:hypothetical protein